MRKLCFIILLNLILFLSIYSEDVLAANTQAMIGYYNITPTAIAPRYRLYNGTTWGSQADAADIGGSPEWIVLKSNYKRNESIMGAIFDTGAEGILAVQIWNWTAGTWGNAKNLTTTIGTTNDIYRGFDIAIEQDSGRALVVYNNGTDTAAYNIWNGTAWEYSDGQSLLNDGCTGTPVWIALSPRPSSNYTIYGEYDTNSDYCAQIWNGTAWINNKTVYQGTVSYLTQRFDVAFESLTGDGMFVFESNTAGAVQYCTYVSDTWCASPSSAFDPGSIHNWLKLASDPASDRIMLGTIETGSSGSFDINAVEWSGTGWGTYSGLDTSTESEGDRTMDVAYIGTTGNAMIVYDDANVNYPTWRNCTGSSCASGSWSSSTNANTTSTSNNCGEASNLDWLGLEEDIFSDDIFLWGSSQATHYKCSQKFSGTWGAWNSSLGLGLTFINGSDIGLTFNQYKLIAWSSPSTNDTLIAIGDQVEHRTRWYGSSGLSGYIFSWNASGASCDTWENKTWTQMIGLRNWSNTTWQIPAACVGKIVGWKIYANDTNNNFDVTDPQTYIVYEIGTLEISLTTPPEGEITNVTQDSAFNANVTIRCVGTTAYTTCGSVDVTLRRNSTTNSPDTLISNIIGSIPFYLELLPLSNYAYDDWNFYVNSQDTTPVDVYFNGTYFWVMGFVNARVFRYSSTGSYNNWNFSVANECAGPEGIYFNGTYFWMTCQTAGKQGLYRYAYNSTYGNYSYDNWNISFGSLGAEGVYFSSDFTYLWMVERSNNIIYRYKYNSTYNNYTYDNWNFSVAAQETYTNDLEYYESKDYFYIVGMNSGRVSRYRYNSTYGNYSYDGWNFTVSSQDSIPEGITYNITYFWMIGRGGTPGVYRYKLNQTNSQSCGNMNWNSNCSLNWTVGATAPIRSAWAIDANLASTVSSANNSADAYVCIEPCTPNTPPQWSSQGQNNSNPNVGEPVLLYANWTDDRDLNWAWLETNETGVARNYTNYTITYTYSGITNPSSTQVAYVGRNASFPPSTISGWDAELNNNNYTYISSSNNVYASQTGTSTDRPTYRFNFSVSGNPSSINNITVLWEGLARSSGVETTVTIFVWNYTSSSWRDIGLVLNDTDINFTKSWITSSEINDILSSGRLHILTETNLSGSSITMWTDFVKLEVTSNASHGSPIDINLTSGQTWSNFTWLNSSVESGTVIQWRIFADDHESAQNVTDYMTFTVGTAEFVSINVSDAINWGIRFGEIEQNTNDNAALNDTNGPDGGTAYNITIDTSSTVNVDLYHDTSDDLKFGGNTILIANVSHAANNTTNTGANLFLYQNPDDLDSIALSKTYAIIGNNTTVFGCQDMAPGSNCWITYWLDVALGITAGNYNTTYEYCGVKIGIGSGQCS